jgi:hypothetical protein
MFHCPVPPRSATRSPASNSRRFRAKDTTIFGYLARVLLGAAMCVCLPSVGMGVTSEDFESHKSGEWVGESGGGLIALDFSGEQGARISGDQSDFSEGSQSMHFFDEDATPAGRATVSLPLAGELAEGRVSFDFRMNNRATGQPAFFIGEAGATGGRLSTNAVRLLVLQGARRIQYEDPDEGWLTVSPKALDPGQWYHFEIAFSVDSSGGPGQFDLKVSTPDGHEVVAAQGLRFRGPARHVNQVDFSVAATEDGSGADYQIDNIVVEK